MHRPSKLEGTIEVYTPDGRLTSAQYIIDRRHGRDERRPYLTLEFLEESDLSYNLIDLILNGNLKALNLDFVINTQPVSVQDEMPKVQDPRAGVGG